MLGPKARYAGRDAFPVKAEAAMRATFCYASRHMKWFAAALAVGAAAAAVPPVALRRRPARVLRLRAAVSVQQTRTRACPTAIASSPPKCAT